MTFNQYNNITTMEDIRTYEERVQDLIRRRYTLSDELALHRQRESKVEEFNEYYAYCEQCKAQARKEARDE